jgi:hypothetical protein|tara:strand:- start:277 stop:507 length:231 start_codon:yes stop_codon:yes gene_type:complete
MKLTDIVVELGRVQTDKDNPPFKTPKQIEKEGIAQPTSQKTDFSKPTLVNLSRKELEILYTTGRIEADGITIIYED